MAAQNKKAKDIFLSDVKVPFGFPFPYRAETFSEKEKKVLSRFFTNHNKPVFAIFGLPQEVVGAMFSRYSRTAKSIRRVFLDEFWGSEELGIKGINSPGNEFQKASVRTADFYKRVFAEYGDDSVIQMGSVHIGFEFVSQIAAKAIEDQRIGAGYIEKSTRYVNFGEKLSGHYLYMEPSEIMNSKFADEFISLNNSLFDAYNKYLPYVISFLQEKYPLEAQIIEDTPTGKLIKYKDIKNRNSKEDIQKAYERALKAKAFDTVRVFLPTTTVTNLGAHLSGQASETMINKMLSSPYSEVRNLGAMALIELLKIAPNFLQNINHPFGETARLYRRLVTEEEIKTSEKAIKDMRLVGKSQEDVRLVDWDKDAGIKVASQILYTAQESNISKSEIWRALKKVRKAKLAEIILASLPDRMGFNRRQKLPRAFEHAYAEVEFYVNFGIFRDLQRHRICSLERQSLTTDDYFIPQEFKQMALKKVLKDYIRHLEWTKRLNEKLNKTKKPEMIRSSEYVTLFGNRLRFNVRANLRQWVFFAELRTIAGGHPTYRNAMQKVAREIIKKIPFTKSLFAHVDWTPDYGLGRLKAEIWTQRRLSSISKRGN